LGGECIKYDDAHEYAADQHGKTVAYHAEIQIKGSCGQYRHSQPWKQRLPWNMLEKLFH
jgi:hypothetical protein